MMPIVLRRALRLGTVLVGLCLWPSTGCNAKGTGLTLRQTEPKEDLRTIRCLTLEGPNRFVTAKNFEQALKKVKGLDPKLVRVFHREVAVRRSLQALRKNELVGILLDQNAGDDGIFVEFFGHPASTAPGAAAFAIRTGAAVVPTFGWRNADDSHTIQIDAPVPLIETGDREKDIRENTQRFAKITEDRIRARPDQWFWLHKRWKSRPPRKTGA